MNFHKMLVRVEQSILTACVVNRLNISLLHMQEYLDRLILHELIPVFPWLASLSC